MRARPEQPEQTQSEDLSDAFFLGKLLVLPTNVRLDWKVIARYKHSSLFGLTICKKEKSFITLTPAGSMLYNLFKRLNKLEFTNDQTLHLFTKIIKTEIIFKSN